MANSKIMTHQIMIQETNHKQKYFNQIDLHDFMQSVLQHFTVEKDKLILNS